MIGKLLDGLTGGIIGNLFGAVSDHFKHKRDLKTMEASLEKTIILEKEKRITSQETADIHWDLAQVKASEGSWKDELWTIIFGGLFIGHFIPPLQPTILKGWEIIGLIPYDWTVVMMGIIAAAFGIRSMMNWKKTNNITK